MKRFYYILPILQFFFLVFHITKAQNSKEGCKVLAADISQNMRVNVKKDLHKELVKLLEKIHMKVNLGKGCLTEKVNTPGRMVMFTTEIGLRA